MVLGLIHLNMCWYHIKCVLRRDLACDTTYWAVSNIIAKQKPSSIVNMVSEDLTALHGRTPQSSGLGGKATWLISVASKKPELRDAPILTHISAFRMVAVGYERSSRAVIGGDVDQTWQVRVRCALEAEDCLKYMAHHAQASTDRRGGLGIDTPLLQFAPQRPASTSDSGSTLFQSCDKQEQQLHEGELILPDLACRLTLEKHLQWRVSHLKSSDYVCLLRACLALLSAWRIPPLIHSTICTSLESWPCCWWLLAYAVCR